MNTNKHELKINDLVYQVVGCAMEVINELGHGLREKTYEKALIVELKRNNFLFSQQKIYRVYEKHDVNTPPFMAGMKRHPLKTV